MRRHLRGSRFWLALSALCVAAGLVIGQPALVGLSVGPFTYAVFR